MIEERQPVRAHKISLLNRNLGVITGVKDVVSFDLNEIILDTDQGLLMITTASSAKASCATPAACVNTA